MKMMGIQHYATSSPPYVRDKWDKQGLRTFSTAALLTSQFYEILPSCTRLSTVCCPVTRSPRLLLVILKSKEMSSNMIAVLSEKRFLVQRSRICISEGNMVLLCADKSFLK